VSDVSGDLKDMRRSDNVLIRKKTCGMFLRWKWLCTV